MSFRYAAIVAGIALPFAGPALAQDTSWCKSKYGPNDEIGAANLLSAEGVLEAAKLIKTGKTYALGVETNNAGIRATHLEHDYSAAQPSRRRDARQH